MFWVVSLDELVALLSTKIANIITFSDILLLLSDILEHFLLNTNALCGIVHLERMFPTVCLLDMTDIILIQAAFTIIDRP